jgi:YggT family protein
MEFVARAVYSGLTLYMLLIMVRWLGGWIGFETDHGRWRWIGLITDPLINRLRSILPNLGPVDFGPIAALFLVWLLRSLTAPMLFGAAIRSGAV